MTDYTYLEVKTHGDIWVARPLHSRLIGDLPAKVGDELLSLAAQSDCLKLLVNLSCVAQMSTEMFGKLIMLNKRMKQKGGSLRLCELVKEIRQILTETGLNRVFEIHDAEADGLAAFSQ